MSPSREDDRPGVGARISDLYDDGVMLDTLGLGADGIESPRGLSAVSQDINPSLRGGRGM